MSFAYGSRAIGICDRCGFQYKLNELQVQTKAGRRTGLKVCKDCLDPDNPRDRPWLYTRRVEAIAVRGPRPDTELSKERGLYGWNPLRGIEIQVFPDRGDSYMGQPAGIPTPIVIDAFILTEGGDQILTESGLTLSVE